MTAPAPARRALTPLPTTPYLSLPALGPPALAFTVYGTPATQGSHEYKGHRPRATKAGVKNLPLVVDDAGPKLKKWRQDVAAAALAALPYDWAALDGPLVMDLTVSLERNSRTPKTLRTVPATKPDLDKLLRAVNDGLGSTLPKIDPKGRTVFTEDSRIVACTTRKVWERDPFDTDSLRRPGAIVRLWSYPEHLLGKVEPRDPHDVSADHWWATLSDEDRAYVRSLASKEADL